MIGLYAIKQRMPVTVLYTSLDHLWFVDHFFSLNFDFQCRKEYHWWPTFADVSLLRECIQNWNVFVLFVSRRRRDGVTCLAEMFQEKQFNLNCYSCPCLFEKNVFSLYGNHQTIYNNGPVAMFAVKEGIILCPG